MSDWLYDLAARRLRAATGHFDAATDLFKQGRGFDGWFRAMPAYINQWVGLRLGDLAAAIERARGDS
ncbi:hypothetical protein [Halomonas getboli]|uniref:hypothetical protein n=1 Tax=Halomonas getboli TaxID=2935862 RepID=UPI001FFE96CB|nr:hypothetical protein [Halomonas getboli]MCK2183528.1 hypothetical protein [Halomonas getboli]